MKGRIIALTRLGIMDWRYLLSSLIQLPLMARSLDGKGLNGILAELHHAPPHHLPPSATQIGEARRVARMVDLAATHGPVHSSCLARSLVVMKFLRKRDIPCELEIGGTLTESPGAIFKAHAWVRCGSEVVNDEIQNISHYKSFALPKSWPNP